MQSFGEFLSFLKGRGELNKGWINTSEPILVNVMSRKYICLSLLKQVDS